MASLLMLLVVMKHKNHLILQVQVSANAYSGRWERAAILEEEVNYPGNLLMPPLISRPYVAHDQMSTCLLPFLNM
jgi:hypothetical protein